ncbi:MAG: extracellular solute-binding protein [Lachnospiraceae bacterium]|nr:extracellular solute-binding protein [Lachnospiraceae bacterium]
MRRLAFVITFALLCGTFLGGCNKKTDSDTGKIPDLEVKNAASAEVKKPEKITMMVDGTLLNVENGRDEFEKKWEELTGVELEIIQPEHDVYYDEVQAAFEGNELPDVVLLSATYYTKYAAMDLLADISQYYQGSDLEKKIKDAGNESLIDAIRLNGKLYGITPTRGNGCITYVKKAWLDNVGMDAPKNYNEYMEMLKAFTEKDPDGNGIEGDTYGVSAAGLMNGESPYVNYLPEFYQDAYPSFYRKEDGSWSDGFLEDSMKSAMLRLKEAYKAGYIDKDIASNGTGDCRDKYYANDYGVFTYWAGTWAGTLKSKLEEAGVNGEIVALEPIEETSKYVERVAPVWCITSKCKNPRGVYKYFLETMLDGGEVEANWSYSPIKDDFSKNHIDHLLALVPIANDPGESKTSEEVKSALKKFQENSVMVDLPYSTDAFAEYNDEITELKTELLKKVVVEDMDIEEAYKEYEAAGGVLKSQAIVDSLNAE